MGPVSLKGREGEGRRVEKEREGRVVSDSLFFVVP